MKTVAFNHDGTILASGSYDKTIKLWNIETKVEIATLKVSGSNGSVCSVAFNDNGKKLISG